LVNETETVPEPNSENWTEEAPAAYTFSAVPGSRTLYAWVRNEAGLINTIVSLSVTLNELNRRRNRPTGMS